MDDIRVKDGTHAMARRDRFATVASAEIDGIQVASFSEVEIGVTTTR